MRLLRAVRRRQEDYLTNFERGTGKATPSFFEEFDAWSTSQPQHHAADFIPAASAEYLRVFAEHLAASAEECTDMDMASLAKATAETIKEDEGWHAIVTGYNAHWFLRDNQQAKFNEFRAAPPSTLVVHWDFQAEGQSDTTFFPLVAIWDDLVFTRFPAF